MPNGGNVLLPTLALSFLLALGLSYWLANSSHRLNALDHPGRRSLHSVAVPRTGGIAILLAILAGWVAAFLAGTWNGAYPGLLVAMLGLAAVSFADDQVSVPPAARLLVHAVVAGLVVAVFPLPALQLSPLPTDSLPGGLVSLVLVALLVWMINLYNFMDGMDGFAGGMGIAGFGMLALMGWRVGALDYVIINLVIVSAILGFLVFNFPPARLFMGDTGSSMLGLLAGAMIIHGAALGLFPLWAGMLVFSVFVVDATVTLIKRLVRGEVVWQAHRQHYYQRLVRLGWGHRKTVLWSYVLMLLSGFSGYWAAGAGTAVQWCLYLGWLAVYALLVIGLSIYIRRGEVSDQG